MCIFTNIESLFDHGTIIAGSGLLIFRDNLLTDFKKKEYPVFGWKFLNGGCPGHPPTYRRSAPVIFYLPGILRICAV